ncbi:hypothetical protein G7085_17750 [Tessaracoccus sp. HDW20]|nr:hypothetical protein [Tessaracoccus coleopterorum]
MSIRPFSRSAAALVAVAAVGLLAACGSGSPTTPDYAATSAPATSAPATSAPVTSAPATEAPAALTLAMADSSLGKILVDGNAMTLYLFTNDSPGKSACEGSASSTGRRCSGSPPPVPASTTRCSGRSSAPTAPPRPPTTAGPCTTGRTTRRPAT